VVGGQAASQWGGTEITSEEMKAGTYLVERYETSLGYSWSSGVAIGRYLEGLKEGIIWGRSCHVCRRTLVPPRMYCEQCFRPTDEWVRLGDTGRVITYSISYVNSDASRRGEPIIVAVIGIDGASPKEIGILHILAEIEPAKVRVGMRVAAVWKEGQSRTGAITDIRYFRPLTTTVGVG
jgi:uncharacterized OB-fold protein